MYSLSTLVVTNIITFNQNHKFIPPSYPTCFPYPYLWNLGVGEAGPKNVGEAENLCF